MNKFFKKLTNCFSVPKFTTSLLPKNQLSGPALEEPLGSSRRLTRVSRATQNSVPVESAPHVGIQKRERTNSMETFIQAFFHQVRDPKAVERISDAYKQYQKEEADLLAQFTKLNSLYAKDKRFTKPQELRPEEFINVPMSKKNQNYIKTFQKVTRLRNQLEADIKKEIEKSLLASSQSPPESPAIAEQSISRREFTNTSEAAALNSQLEQESESGESVVAYSTDLDSINVSLTSEASSSEITAVSETTAEVPAPRDVVEKPSKKE